MIFARSNRTFFLAIASGMAVTVTFAVAAVLVALAHGFELVTVALGMGCALGLALAGSGAWQLWAWPPRRLAFFRDRMVMVEGNVEQHAAWERIETATLAGPIQWGGGSWPEIRISDRLTVVLKRGKSLTLRPADFGLAPTGCRDLVLMLRDDRQLRGRLPEFDSALDLSERPVVTGELITPRL